MKMVRSVLHTGRLNPQEIFLVLISLKAMSTQGHIVAGKIMSMTQSGIEPEKFQLVAQFFNQLRYGVLSFQKNYQRI